MLDKLLKLTLFQTAVAMVLILIITATRLFFSDTFEKYKSRYEDYFYFDTDNSLVDGEET